MNKDWVDKFNERKREKRVKEVIKELAPTEARTSEDLIYLNYDVIEELLDMAKVSTEFESGGFLCGKNITGQVKWGGGKVVHYYDFVFCRNVATQPKKVYRPYKKCIERVKEVYEEYTHLHTHPYSMLPSGGDINLLVNGKLKPLFLVTPTPFYRHTL